MQPRTFRNQRVTVMGLGLHGGGLGTVRFLLREGAKEILVTDLRTKKVLQPTISQLPRSKRIRYILGKHRLQDFTYKDAIIKNPSVRPDSPYLANARLHKIPVVNDVGIFFIACPAPIIGVTGTRAKSTTAHLIAEFLKRGAKRSGKRVWFGGNIRRSVLEMLPRIRSGDYVILELSSFQLMDMQSLKKSPEISVLTNILNDHLNWHKNAAEYALAKSYIFRFQKSSDHLFIPAGDRVLAKLTEGAASQIHHVILPQKYRNRVVKNIGSHYISAVGLAIAVARHLGIPQSAIDKTLSSFHGLPSRGEKILTLRGVDFVNDTTATIPDASIAALRRFGRVAKKRGGRVIMIAGGSDKHLNFHHFALEAEHFAKAIILLPGTATDKMKKELKQVKFPRAAIQLLPSMADAVRTAYERSRSGDIVLLSPGAASFGLFNNEFHRGAEFIKSIKKLK